MGVQALAVDSTKTLKPFVVIAGKDMEGITAVRIKSLDSRYSTLLTRTGTQIYEGTLTVDTHGLQIGECLKFIAEVTTAKGILTSQTPDVLCVTSFSTEYQPYQDVWSDTVIKGTHFALNSFDAIFNEGVSEQKIKELVAKINGKVVTVHFGTTPRIYVILLEPYPKSMPELLKIMSQFRSNPEVRQVEMTFGAPLSSMQPNDPLISSQTWLRTIGADETWYVARGDSARAIAVLDSGIDLNHVEFQNKILTSSSKDFVNQGGITVPHGTHVAGVAAAKTNNGEGIAGVASNSSLIDVKIAAGSGSSAYASPARMVEGINYSATLQKPIVNFSVGFQETSNWFCNTLFSFGMNSGGFFGLCYTQDNIDIAKTQVCGAVQQAMDKKVFLVAAAGNAATTDKVIPASCEGTMLAVGATDNGKRYEITNPDPIDGDMLSGSNYGTWVDIAAPGRDILSTMLGGLYKETSGTSESTPMVSGAAAVLMSRHPDWTNQQVKERLKYAAHFLPGEGLGWGELRLFEAVFNGNFELVDPYNKPLEWQQYANINNVDDKVDKSCLSNPEYPLPLTTTDNKRVLVCDNTNVVSAGVMNELDIPEGVTQLPISFDWRMMSQDLTAAGGTASTVVNYCYWDYDWNLYYIYGYLQQVYTCSTYPSARNDRVLVQLTKVDTNKHPFFRLI